MPRELHLDGETFSALDLTEVGSYKYFEHPSTDVWCVAWAFDDEEPELWHPGLPVPERVVSHIEEGGIITAWNAAFERLMIKAVLTKRYGWPTARDEQFRCTMTEALSMALPGKLERAAPAAGLQIAKDEKGHRLMMQMCRPRKIKGSKEIHKWDDDDRKTRLYEYCKQDVRVEQAMAKRLMRLRPSEEKLYFLDMKINDRGVFIDTELCKAAGRIVAKATAQLDLEMQKVTGGAVGGVTSVVPLIAFLKACGVETNSVDKEHVEDLLILELPANCRRALEIRQEGAKTSTAKIQAMLDRQQADGRMRGNLQFYGAAATGRWAARGAQLQNLTRPVILKGKDIEGELNEAIEEINGGDVRMIEVMYGRPLTLVSDCIRSMICAPEGKVLMSSDFSNIEGRGVAWEAGQEDKLDAFRAFDKEEGPDLYLVAAGGIYGVPVAQAQPHRQIGKVAELSLGYQGGPRAFAKMSKNYGVRIGQLYDGIWAAAKDEHIEAAMKGWEDRGKKSGMEQRGWLAAEVIKLAWRDKNYRIKTYWSEVERAAIAAVANPGEIYAASKVRFRKVGSFLFCLLPSGRALCYPYPRLREKMTPWGETRQSMIYKGNENYQWVDKAYYGGLGVENITQAIARDVMAEAMLRVEEAGYETVLTVHDEIVVEVDDDFGSLEEFNRLMTVPPAWAEGFPITVSGWRGHRYRKG